MQADKHTPQREIVVFHQPLRFRVLLQLQVDANQHSHGLQILYEATQKITVLWTAPSVVVMGAEPLTYLAALLGVQLLHKFNSGFCILFCVFGILEP